MVVCNVLAVQADLSREKPRRFWDPGRKLLKSIRDYQRLQVNPYYVARLWSKSCVLRHIFWSAVSGADIPLTCSLGGGLLIPHPNGIVLHPDAKIGINCLIHQQVTIGVKRGNNNPPTVDGHVDIGAGAKILGEISIGKHALIGANAVVTKNVAPYEIVAGIPARKIGNVQKIANK